MSTFVKVEAIDNKGKRLSASNTYPDDLTDAEILDAVEKLKKYLSLHLQLKNRYVVEWV